MPDDGRWRMEEQAYRNRVSWMMFLLSILVIWVHSYNVELFAGGLWGPSWESAAWLEDFLSVTVGQIAVPGFFLLSSCLFFRNFTWEKLASKWKRRFFSVAVPYGVWNLLYYFGYVTATRLPCFEIHDFAAIEANYLSASKKRHALHLVQGVPLLFISFT